MFKTIGVIGAGQMGSGITHVCVLSGYNVLLNDISEESLKNALVVIDKNMSRQVKKGQITEEQKLAGLAKITLSASPSIFKSADLIIEAATENEQLKNKIFESLREHLSPHTILASNTSSLSITRLAAKSDRPDRFMGLHFMNPVPVMQLVELIRGIATSKETFDAVREFAQSLGKQTAVSEDFPAFIVNRVLIPMINEAIYTLYEGVGNVAAIDDCLKLGANHPMGPLQLADFIGLDTCLAIMQVLHEGLADTKYRPCPLLVKYVEAGWLGRKAGKGFYDYAEDPPVPTR